MCALSVTSFMKLGKPLCLSKTEFSSTLKQRYYIIIEKGGLRMTWNISSVITNIQIHLEWSRIFKIQLIYFIKHLYSLAMCQELF